MTGNASTGLSRLHALVEKLLADGSVPDSLRHSVLTLLAMRPEELSKLRLILAPGKYGKLLAYLWEYGIAEWGDDSLIRVGVPLAIWHQSKGRLEQAREVWGPIEQLLRRGASARTVGTRRHAGRTAARVRRCTLRHLSTWSDGDDLPLDASAQATAALGVVAAVAGADSLSAALMLDAKSRRDFGRDPKSAIGPAKKALVIREGLLSARSWLVWRSRRKLGALLVVARRRAEGRRLLRRCEKDCPEDPITLGWLLKLRSGRRTRPANPGTVRSTFGVLARAVESPGWFGGEGRCFSLPERYVLFNFLWERVDRLGDDAWRIALGLELAFTLAKTGSREEEIEVWEGIARLQAEWGEPGRHVRADRLVTLMHDLLMEHTTTWWKSVRPGSKSAERAVFEALRPFEPQGRRSDQFLAFLEEPSTPELPSGFPRVAAALPVARELMLIVSGSKRPEIYHLLAVLAAVEARAGSEHPCTASCLNRLSILLLRGGVPEAAVEPARTALRIREVHFGSGNDLVSLCTANLAAVELACERYDVAEDLLHRARRISPARPLAYYWFAKLYKARSAPGDRPEEIRNWREYLRLERGREPRIAEARDRLEEIEGNGHA